MSHVLGFWARRVGLGLGLVGVVLAVLAVRVVLESRTELEAGDARMEADDLSGAIDHYRRAVRAYAPGSPYPSRAVEALVAIAKQAEVTGDVPRALAAWRSIRGGIMATRSFYVPHEAALDQANHRIADLMAAADRPPIDASKSQTFLAAEHLALLEEAGTRPHVGYTFVLLLGFVIWVVAAFLFAQKAIDEEDRIRPRPALLFSGVFALGLGLFILGMMWA